MARCENLIHPMNDCKSQKCVHWWHSESSLDLPFNSCAASSVSTASCDADEQKCSRETTPCQQCTPKYRGRRIRRRRRADRSRITRLAVPKHFTPRHKYRLPFAVRRSAVPIDRHHVQKPITTRLLQLALPTVRCLRSARNKLRGTLPEKRFNVLNKHLQASLFTMYTRLANVPMPQKRVKPKIDWAAHEAWLKTRAKPKTRFVPAAAAWVAPSFIGFPTKINLLNLERLAQHKPPVRGHLAAKSETHISPQALTYTMTPTMTKLTAPRPKPSEDPILEYDRPNPVPRRYNTIRSMGITKLAIPRVTNKRWTRGDNASVVFLVPRNALKYKASERIKTLADARKSDGGESHVRPNPYRVSPKALKKLKAKQEAIFVKLMSRKRTDSQETIVKVAPKGKADTVKGKASKDKTTKEKDTKEKTTKDKATKEKTTKDKTTKDKKSEGKSSKTKTPKEKTPKSSSAKKEKPKKAADKKTAKKAPSKKPPSKKY